VGHLEKHDVQAAVNFVRAYDSNQKVAIIGRSLGGAATVLASPDVDAIVLESVYPTVTEAVHNRIQMRVGVLHNVIAPLLLVQLNPRLGVSPDQLQPIADIRNIHCPVVIAAGDCDEHTTINETYGLFGAANDPKKLVVFNGAGHADLLAYDPSQYEDEIIGYLDQVIGDRIRRAE
jgi:pimeloyl-ACP methyl ester carboxylesterase